MTFTYIEVCAGAGGLSTGFEHIGFKLVLLNEIDKSCCSTLRLNHPTTPIHEGSISELKLDEEVDVLAGGIPCQSYSQAGLRKGLSDQRGQLVYEFNRLVHEANPKVFLIENVKGLVSHQQGRTLDTIVRLLSNDGTYTIQYQVLNANDFQVPQKRERLIIVGVRSDIRKKFKFPSITQDRKLVLRDVLMNVPSSPCGTYSEKKKEIMDLVPPGGCWVNLPLERQREYLGERMLASGGGKRGVARRLSMDEACLTILTSPSQKQTERCHPTETRPFSIRESARIQTFPDDYVFSGSVSSQYKQIGNAVPVQLAKRLAEEVKILLE